MAMTLLKISGFKRPIILAISTFMLVSASRGIAEPTQGQMCSGLNCLPIITFHTRKILEQVNNIPGYLATYLTSVTKMADSWLQTKDDANTIGNNLKPFSDYASGSESVLNYQIQNTITFSKDFLLAGTNTTSGNPNPTLPPNANQLIYSIVLGQPADESQYPGLHSKIQTPAQKQKLSDQLKQDINAYIKNVSGTNFVLKQPTAGSTADEINYRTFYNALSADQSFNTFILSSLFYQNFTDDMTKKLMDIASKDTWITQIGTEDLGLVIRHILMYCTGMFMELNHIQQMMQQSLILQGMNNSMQAVNYENNLSQLAKAPKAGGAPYIPK